MAATCGVALGGGGPPPNDFCSDPSTATCGSNFGTNVEASGGFTGTCTFGNGNIWFEFVAPVTANYTIDTIGSGVLDTVLSVQTGCEGTQLACDDDSASQTTMAGHSRLRVFLSSGQRVLIEVATFGVNNNSGTVQVNIACSENRLECCQPWDNGDIDRRNGQTSQIGFGEDWRVVGRVTADDFWLCEGNIYRINTLSAKLLTDSIVPKADIIIVRDCDGLPNVRDIVAIAESVPQTNVDPSLECQYGTVTITETGEVDSDGFRFINVEANWDKLHLEGGAYWVIVYGFSGTGDADEQFFWLTSGNQVVKGRPGHFSETDLSTELVWTSIDEICCGCTDFNFCLSGEECKILLDNGRPTTERSNIVGEPSLQTGSTSQVARSADQFVVPPCNDVYLCYAEAWVWTNCERISFSLFSNDCHLPNESAPLATFDAQCVIDTEITTFVGNTQVSLKKAIFFDFNQPTIGGGRRGYLLEAGRNYWFSAFAQGDNRQNAKGFFAFNSYCDRACWINFDPGAVKGPPYVTGRWRSTSDLSYGARDFAFLVAVEPAELEIQPPDDGTGTTCAADVNRDNVVSLQDLFDYLQAFFTGCP